MTTVERFWNKVDIGSREECWTWEAGVNYFGYGEFRVDGKKTRSHRYSFFLHNGFYPPVVMHTCDNPPCVNPSHLQAGTYLSNNLDCIIKGRNNNGHSKKTHCPRGHPYDEANTYYKIADGGRTCRACNNQKQKNRAKRTSTTTTTTTTK